MFQMSASDQEFLIFGVWGIHFRLCMWLTMSASVRPNTADDVAEAFRAKWAHVPAVVRNPKRPAPALDCTVAKFITGKISYIQACGKVPSSTVAWRLKALRVGRPLQKRGPTSVLTAAHEEQLMAWMKSEWLRMEPPYKNDILLQAKVMAHAHGLPFDTKNGLSSDKWFFGFPRRNKLSDRVVQHMAEARIQAAREVNIGEWYQSVKDEVDQQHVTSAERIFNMDEAGHSRCYNIYKGVAAPRRRPAWSIQRFCEVQCVCLCRSQGSCTTLIPCESRSKRTKR